jgi:uncharacterized protein YPO0396
MYRPYILALSIQKIIRGYYHDPRMPLMERIISNIARLSINFRLYRLVYTNEGTGNDTSPQRRPQYG